MIEFASDRACQFVSGLTSTKLAFEDQRAQGELTPNQIKNRLGMRQQTSHWRRAEPNTGRESERIEHSADPARLLDLPSPGALAFCSARVTLKTAFFWPRRQKVMIEI